MDRHIMLLQYYRDSDSLPIRPHKTGDITESNHVIALPFLIPLRFFGPVQQARTVPRIKSNRL